MKKNKTKKLLPIALVGLLTIGASAWLTNIEEAKETNLIKPGTMTVVFDNEKTVIGGVEGTEDISVQNVIPQTQAYAAANNDYYTFTIDNDSTLDIDYKVIIDKDTYSNTFADGKVEMLVAEVAEDADEAAIRSALASGKSVVVASEAELISAENLASKGSVRYAVMLNVDESAVNADVIGNSASMKLRVNANQSNQE